MTVARRAARGFGVVERDSGSTTLVEGVVPHAFAQDGRRSIATRPASADAAII